MCADLTARGIVSRELRSLGVDVHMEMSDYRDVANCKLNIPYMQDLGLNSLRVYSVDNSAYQLCHLM
jgi:hypothetical protein